MTIHISSLCHSIQKDLRTRQMCQGPFMALGAEINRAQPSGSLRAMLVLSAPRSTQQAMVHFGSSLCDSCLIRQFIRLCCLLTPSEIVFYYLHSLSEVILCVPQGVSDTAWKWSSDAVGKWSEREGEKEFSRGKGINGKTVYHLLVPPQHPFIMITPADLGIMAGLNDLGWRSTTEAQGREWPSLSTHQMDFTV